LEDVCLLPPSPLLLLLLLYGAVDYRLIVVR
jgi:hypothetical protein